MSIVGFFRRERIDEAVESAREVIAATPGIDHLAYGTSIVPVAAKRWHRGPVTWMVLLPIAADLAPDADWLDVRRQLRIAILRAAGPGT